MGGGAGIAGREDEMTRDEVVRFLEQRQRHWVARDPDGLASQHAFNGTVNSPMFGKLSGREAIAQSRLWLVGPFIAAVGFVAGDSLVAWACPVDRR